MVDLSGNYRSNPLQTFDKLLRSWEPQRPDDARSLPTREPEWRESLRRHLVSKFGDTGSVRVVSDYGVGIRRVDLGLERKRTLRTPIADCVELKVGLNRSKFHDLNSEIEGVKGTDHWTFGLVCGPKSSLESHYLDELRKRYTYTWKDSNIPRIAIFLKQGDTKKNQRVTRLLATADY